MKKLNKETAQALTNLRGSPDFDRVLKWLAENRETYRDECCTTDGITLHRAQGKVTVVNDIFKCVKQAPEVTEKFKNQER